MVRDPMASPRRSWVPALRPARIPSAHRRSRRRARGGGRRNGPAGIELRDARYSNPTARTSGIRKLRPAQPRDGRADTRQRVGVAGSLHISNWAPSTARLVAPASAACRGAGGVPESTGAFSPAAKRRVFPPGGGSKSAAHNGLANGTASAGRPRATLDAVPPPAAHPHPRTGVAATEHGRRAQERADGSGLRAGAAAQPARPWRSCADDTSGCAVGWHNALLVRRPLADVRGCGAPRKSYALRLHVHIARAWRQYQTGPLGRGPRYPDHC